MARALTTDAPAPAAPSNPSPSRPSVEGGRGGPWSSDHLLVGARLRGRLLDRVDRSTLFRVPSTMERTVEKPSDVMRPHATRLPQARLDVRWEASEAGGYIGQERGSPFGEEAHDLGSHADLMPVLWRVVQQPFEGLPQPERDRHVS